MRGSMDLFNFFAYLKDGEIRRMLLTRELQEKLTQIFVNKLSTFLPDDRDKILRFEENAGYKPEDDEVFVINNFKLPSEIIGALENPVNYNRLEVDEYENIKATFCGKCDIEHSDERNCVIIFTTFDTRKIIPSRSLKHVLFFRNVFTEFNQRLLVLDEKIDVLFKHGNLYFRSLYNAKRVFGDSMNEYYREATNDEVKEFGKKSLAT